MVFIYLFIFGQKHITQGKVYWGVLLPGGYLTQNLEQGVPLGIKILILFPHENNGLSMAL